MEGEKESKGKEREEESLVESGKGKEKDEEVKGTSIVGSGAGLTASSSKDELKDVPSMSSCSSPSTSPPPSSTTSPKESRKQEVPPHLEATANSPNSNSEGDLLAKKLAKTKVNSGVQAGVQSVKMKKVDEAVAAWSGVDLNPFPGIPTHDCKELIIEDKLQAWLGSEDSDPSSTSSTSYSSSSGGSGSGSISPSKSLKGKEGWKAGVPNESRGRSKSVALDRTPTKDKEPILDIKSRHHKIEEALANWANIPEDVLVDPKNPNSSAAAFPGIRLHIIKDKPAPEDMLAEIEKNVAAWAGDPSMVISPRNK